MQAPYTTHRVIIINVCLSVSHTRERCQTSHHLVTVWFQFSHVKHTGDILPWSPSAFLSKIRFILRLPGNITANSGLFLLFVTWEFCQSSASAASLISFTTFHRQFVTVANGCVWVCHVGLVYGICLIQTSQILTFLMPLTLKYKNSSGDKIANVNFLRRYRTHVSLLQNTEKETNLFRLTN